MFKKFFRLELSIISFCSKAFFYVKIREQIELLRDRRMIVRKSFYSMSLLLLGSMCQAEILFQVPQDFLTRLEEQQKTPMQMLCQKEQQELYDSHVKGKLATSAVDIESGIGEPQTLADFFKAIQYLRASVVVDNPSLTRSTKQKQEEQYKKAKRSLRQIYKACKFFDNKDWDPLSYEDLFRKIDLIYAFLEGDYLTQNAQQRAVHGCEFSIETVLGISIDVLMDLIQFRNDDTLETKDLKALNLLLNAAAAQVGERGAAYLTLKCLQFDLMSANWLGYKDWSLKICSMIRHLLDNADYVQINEAQSLNQYETCYQKIVFLVSASTPPFAGYHQTFDPWWKLQKLNQYTQQLNKWYEDFVKFNSIAKILVTQKMVKIAIQNGVEVPICSIKNAFGWIEKKVMNALDFDVLDKTSQALGLGPLSAGLKIARHLNKNLNKISTLIKQKNFSVQGMFKTLSDEEMDGFIKCVQGYFRNKTKTKYLFGANQRGELEEWKRKNPNYKSIFINKNDDEIITDLLSEIKRVVAEECRAFCISLVLGRLIVAVGANIDIHKQFKKHLKKLTEDQLYSRKCVVLPKELANCMNDSSIDPTNSSIPKGVEDPIRQFFYLVSLEIPAFKYMQSFFDDYKKDEKKYFYKYWQSARSGVYDGWYSNSCFLINCLKTEDQNICARNIAANVFCAESAPVSEELRKNLNLCCCDLTKGDVAAASANFLSGSMGNEGPRLLQVFNTTSQCFFAFRPAAGSSASPEEFSYLTIEPDLIQNSVTYYGASSVNHYTGYEPKEELLRTLVAKGELSPFEFFMAYQYILNELMPLGTNGQSRYNAIWFNRFYKKWQTKPANWKPGID